MSNLELTSCKNARGGAEWEKSQSAFAYLSSASDALAGAIRRKQYEYISNVLFKLVAARWTTRLRDTGGQGEEEEESEKRFPKHEFFKVRLANAPNRDALLAKSICDDAIWIW